MKLTIEGFASELDDPTALVDAVRSATPVQILGHNWRFQHVEEGNRFGPSGHRKLRATFELLCEVPRE